MRYKYYSIAVIIFATILISSCGPALYIPEKHDEKNGASLTQLMKGRELYTEKCGRCHSLYLPENFTVREWSLRVDEMSGRAKISDEEKALILRYIELKARQ